MTDYDAERGFADQERTSQGAQKPGLIAEHEVKSYRRIDAIFKTRPTQRITLSLNALHTDNKSSYTVNNTRDSHNITDEVTAAVGYMPHFGGSFAFNMSHTLVDLDFEGLALNSRNDVKKSVGLSYSRTFASELSIDLAMKNGIDQVFYKSEENTRDRDQVDLSLDARARSTLTENITVSIRSNYTQTDFVNVDSSLSVDNRRKQTLRSWCGLQLPDHRQLAAASGLWTRIRLHRLCVPAVGQLSRPKPDVSE